MRRCKECGRPIWPWQESRPDYSFYNRMHVGCWHRYWDGFFARHTPESIVGWSDRTLFWKLVLSTPEVWSKRLTDALEAWGGRVDQSSPTPPEPTEPVQTNAIAGPQTATPRGLIR